MSSTGLPSRSLGLFAVGKMVTSTSGFLALLLEISFFSFFFGSRNDTQDYLYLPAGRIASLSAALV